MFGVIWRQFSTLLFCDSLPLARWTRGLSPELLVAASLTFLAGFLLRNSLLVELRVGAALSGSTCMYLSVVVDAGVCRSGP
jgi:hypothetical protein